MFGINDITWPEFIKFIAFALIAWYGLLIILGWIKLKQYNRKENFEEYQSGITDYETLQPVTVSSNDYPSEILSIDPALNDLLPASFYEETGYDEGLSLEHFVAKNSPVLAKMILEIHFQQ